MLSLLHIENIAVIESADIAFGPGFNALTGEYEGFSISLSMGVAQTDRVGMDYDALFHAADNALYAVKRGGRGQYLFYDETMRDTLSNISPIVQETREVLAKEEDKK